MDDDGTPSSSPSLLDPSKQTDGDEYVQDDMLPDECPPPIDWQFQPLQLNEANFFHSGHKIERQKIFDALRANGKHKQLHRFANCGSDCRVLRRVNGNEMEFSLGCNRCRNRFCPLCSRCRSTILAANVAALVRQRECGAMIRLVTLTLRHGDTPLRDQIQRLFSCFHNMKRRQWWKAHVTGGVMFTEIKIGRDQKWHVHCHCICESSYMPQQELSDEWHAVTGDSPVVDVRMIADVDRVAGYVAKYGAKSIDRQVIFSQSKLCEAMRALAGTRVATTFGSWRGTRLSASPDDTTGGEWQDMGSLESVYYSQVFDEIKKIKPKLAERIEKCFRTKRKINESG